MNINDFTMKLPKYFLYAIMSSWVVVAVLCVLMSVDNPIFPSANNSNIGPMVLFFIAFHTLVTILSLAFFSRWKIHVHENTFYYNPGYGSSKEFTIEDIHRIERKNAERGIEHITLYSYDKVLVTVTSKHVGYDLFLEFLIQKGLLDNG